jgi:protein phosphatase PTC7
MIPHPDKVKKGGEDACFANSDMLLVADGVGGWAAVT